MFFLHMQYAVIVFFSGLTGSFCLILSDWCSSCVRWLRFCSIISLCRHLRGCSWKLFIFTVCKQKRETSTMEPWDSTMLLAGESLLSLQVCKHTHAHMNTHTHTHTHMHARTHAHAHTHTHTHTHKHTCTHARTHTHTHTVLCDMYVCCRAGGRVGSRRVWQPRFLLDFHVR